MTSGRRVEMATWWWKNWTWPRCGQSGISLKIFKRARSAWTSSSTMQVTDALRSNVKTLEVTVVFVSYVHLSNIHNQNCDEDILCDRSCVFIQESWGVLSGRRWRVLRCSSVSITWDISFSPTHSWTWWRSPLQVVLLSSPAWRMRVVKAEFEHFSSWTRRNYENIQEIQKQNISVLLVMCLFFVEFMSNARLFVAGEISFDDINLDNDYCPRRSYQQSKLANVLFARELAARLQGRLSVCDWLCVVQSKIN